MEGIKKGKIKVEILVKDIEKILNILWLQNIPASKVKKVNITTLRLEIDYMDYERVCEIVRSVGGKVRVLEGKGPIFLLGNMKKRYSIVIAVVVFFAIIFFLSTYIWSIDITVGKNVTPFEIREQLKEIGISPGVRKASLDEKEIEKKLESLNSEILWLRVRVEGSTLKVVITEKVNPPVKDEGKYGNLVADMDGQIKRVYTYSGRAAVKNSDVVKKGEVVIEGVDGNEGGEYVVRPSGMVIANTFYEKEKYEISVFWYENAINNPPKPGSLNLVNIAMYTWVPALQLCVCYSKISDFNKANEYNELAARYVPNHSSVINNRKYLLDKVK